MLYTRATNFVLGKVTMKLTIPGRFPSLNEYTASNRANRFKGAQMKKDAEIQVIQAIKLSKLKPVQSYPVTLTITWYEKDRRRDIDNITYAIKFCLDSLVKAKILTDDSQKFVTEINNKVEVDSLNPRVEIEITEGSNDG